MIVDNGAICSLKPLPDCVNGALIGYLLNVAYMTGDKYVDGCRDR